MSLNTIRTTLFRPTSIPRTKIPLSQNTRSIHYSYPRSSTTTSNTSSTPSHMPHGHAQHGHQHQHSHANQNQSGRNGKKPSPHMVWYREIVPAMIPIFLISTTLFLSLSLLRTHLSHSKSLEESNLKISQLESQLNQLRLDKKRLRLREKKERERMLPLVVERVLQRVGVVGEEVDEGDVEVEERELPRLL